MSDAPSPLSREQLGRAMRMSYTQAMLGSIYAASTGGMFLIGYALKLGADNVRIGLLSTIPMLCIVAQLFSALLVERGYSRRRLTFISALLNVAGWGLIILIPYLAAAAPAGTRVAALIAVVTLVTMFGYFCGNARASWIGELIPESRRGNFFGRMTMYGSIIATLFAVMEGKFLDYVKDMGVGAFSWLFGFGMVFGLVNALLFVPQPDIPLTHEGPSPPRFRSHVRATFTNAALLSVMLYAVLWSLQNIAAPFYATYLLRDMKMGFKNLGLLNAATMLTMIGFSPFWGRIVDRYGCRPILLACTAALAPLPLVWLGLKDLRTIYLVITPVNLFAGFAISGVSVALNTMVYKATPTSGRSVQLAIYSVVVVLLAAPMPWLGGHLPELLGRAGLHVDLRCTFYASAICCTLAAVAAGRIREANSRRVGHLLRNLPGHLIGRWD